MHGIYLRLEMQIQPVLYRIQAVTSDRMQVVYEAEFWAIRHKLYCTFFITSIHVQPYVSVTNKFIDESRGRSGVWVPDQDCAVKPMFAYEIESERRSYAYVRGAKKSALSFKINSFSCIWFNKLVNPLDQTGIS